MAKNRVSVTGSWQLISNGPVTIVISKIGAGTLYLNNAASDVNARKYGPADLAPNTVISQVDSGVPTYVRASDADEWAIETSEPGDGRFLDGVPDPISGTGVDGAIEVQQSEYAARTQNDSFARQRASIATTLFDAKMTYGIPEEYDQLAVNGATITPEADLSGATLAVAAVASSRAVLQQAQYSLYQPGNGHDIRATYGNIVLAGACVFRVGYFDDDNGPYLRYNGDGTLQAGLRSSVTGSPVDTLVDQADWNIDPMDGTGPSGITLDFNARQIFAPDLEWLSVGTVQIGFFINRTFVPVHSFDFANSDGAAYMTTADLPVRWELEGDGVNVASVVAECCVVQSSGSDAPAGKPFAVSSGYPSVTTTETLLFAIRPKTALNGKPNHVDIQLVEVDALAADESLEIVVRYNGTVDNTGWADVDPDSATEVSTTAVWAVGTGRKVRAFPVVASGGGQGQPGQQGKSLQGKPPFTLHLDGSTDNIVVTARVIDGAGSSNAFATGQLVERI